MYVIADGAEFESKYIGRKILRRDKIRIDE